MKKIDVIIRNSK